MQVRYCCTLCVVLRGNGCFSRLSRKHICEEIPIHDAASRALPLAIYGIFILKTGTAIAGILGGIISFVFVCGLLGWWSRRQSGAA